MGEVTFAAHCPPYTLDDCTFLYGGVADYIRQKAQDDGSSRLFFVRWRCRRHSKLNSVKKLDKCPIKATGLLYQEHTSKLYDIKRRKYGLRILNDISRIFFAGCRISRLNTLVCL